jgi:hypothetical protein
VTDAGLYKVYINGSELHPQMVANTFPPGTTMNLSWLFGITKTGHRCWNGHIDDTFVFNRASILQDNIGALSQSLYDDSRLKLRLEMQDATDTQGNYDGTEYGSCIDSTRFKYHTKSLTSDGLVVSTKYIEMVAVGLVESMGLSFSFWFYNPVGLASADSMLFEAKQDTDSGPTLYLTQYKTDRTKFRFSDDTGCIVYAATGAWHKIVITITADDFVNMWIDDSNDVVNVSVALCRRLGWTLLGGLAKTSRT